MRSQIEQRHREYEHQELLPFIFFDRNDTPFHAKPDLKIGDTYIELKAHPLHENTKTSIKSSRTKLASQYKWHFKKEPPEHFDHNDLSGELWHKHPLDCLLHAWNHSLEKHKIVSKKMKEEGYGYVVAFEKHPPLVEKKVRGKVFMIPFKDYYKQYHDLDVILESELSLLKDSTSVIH